MKSKYHILTIGIICTLLIMSIPGFGICGDSYKLTIATGGTGGTYYPCGGGVGELLRSKLDIVEAATAEVTAGSVENAQLINRGKTDMGLICWIGVVGADLKDKLPNLRTMFFIHGSTVH